MRGPYRKHRQTILQPSDQSYRLISLTRGQVAKIDPEDYECVNQFKWFADWSQGMHSFYAKGRIGDATTNPIRMHRFIMNAPEDKEVDHINGDTLDNRKANLRLCTQAENNRNRKKSSLNTSGYTGVNKKKNRWCARTSFDGKRIHIGYFSDAEEAAHAYDEAVKKHHGEFAKTNFS